MIDIAVTAIASPISAFLTNGSGISLRTGEAGCSIKAVKTHAEIMKIPSSAPSIKYSGQCRVRAKPAPQVSDVALLPTGKDGAMPRCVAGAGEICVSVTRDRIRIGAISDRDQQKELQK